MSMESRAVLIMKTSKKKLSLNHPVVWVVGVGLLSLPLIPYLMPSPPETCETLKNRETALKTTLGSIRLNYEGSERQSREYRVSTSFDELETKWAQKQCTGRIDRPYPIISY